jgi:F-type H+-transporting ATPase subunit b
VDIVAVAGVAAAGALTLAAEESEGAGLVINIFWIIVASANFLLLLALLWAFGFGPISRTLASRRDRIERGLADAEQARRDRESAERERLSTLADARREASEILARAQKVATETREADIATTKSELERLRQRATADIEAERTRAIADLRAEVAELALAAATKVVRESMTDARQRRLVDEFLTEATAADEPS